MRQPDAQPMRLCLVRHGETDWNAGKRVQGQIDIPLSAVGHAQARATGNALKDEGFAALYSSDLTRARQTAEATAHLAKLPLHLMPELRERHFGLFQGLTYAEAETRHPEAFVRHRARDPLFTPDGGESLTTFAERLMRVFAEIAGRHPGAAVAIFTHGGVLDIAHRKTSGQPLHAPRDFDIPNCGINWIEIAGDRWTRLSWAERGHLQTARDEL